MRTPLPTGLAEALELVRQQLRAGTPVDTADHVSPDHPTPPQVGRQQLKMQYKQLLATLEDMEGSPQIPMPPVISRLTDDGTDELYVRSDTADYDDMVAALAYALVSTAILRKMATESALVATGLMVRLETTESTQSTGPDHLDSTDQEVVA